MNLSRMRIDDVMTFYRTGGYLDIFAKEDAKLLV